MLGQVKILRRQIPAKRKNTKKTAAAVQMIRAVVPMKVILVQIRKVAVMIHLRMTKVLQVNRQVQIIQNQNEFLLYKF